MECLGNNNKNTITILLAHDFFGFMYLPESFYLLFLFVHFNMLSKFLDIFGLILF